MKTYQCPGCGAPLAYSGESGKLECASCGNRYALSDVEALDRQTTSSDVRFSMETADFGAEESAQVRSLICQSCGADLISMVAPTSEERIAMVAKEANGFIYVVSSLGVTGVRSEITTDIGAMVKLIRESSDLPCAVGFGISTPEQAKKMAGLSDGAIVGSAIVKLLAQHGREAVPYVADYVKQIRRLPYTLRSSSAILRQIPASMEEASISLGIPPLKSFLRITAVLMFPGVFSGAILSWITVINELSSSVILYSTKTRTLSVAVYTEVVRGSHGTAAALSTILTALTLLSLLIAFRVSGKEEVQI